MRKATLLVMTSVALCGVRVSAGAAPPADKMPGGTWEMRHKVEFPDMPPEMAARMGARVTTVCIKPGERNWPEPRMANDRNERKCEQTALKVDGDKATWKMKCTDGTTTEGELVHNGRDHYTLTVSISGPRGSSKAVTEGTRISESCEQK